MAIELVLVVLSLVFAFLIFRHFRQNNLLLFPPSPLALPIIGHFHLLSPLIHRSFHDLSLRLGPVFSLRLGSVSCVVVSSPELAKEFLKTHELSFINRPANIAAASMTYDASFTFASHGPYWKFVRKLTTNELLNNISVDKFLPIRNQEYMRLYRMLAKKAEVCGPVNFSEELPNVGHNIMGKMLLGNYSSLARAAKFRVLVRDQVGIKTHGYEYPWDLFTASIDTTSITMEWVLAEVINHPEVFKKAREEIDQVVETGRLIGESDLPNLPYIQAILKETPRLHPPLPLVPRICTQECKVGKYMFPEKTLLFINNWAMGRDPKNWENPLEFKPERFLQLDQSDSTNGVDIRGQHFHCLPFGYGRRMCPGLPLTMKMLPTQLVVMIQCFDFKVSGARGKNTSNDHRVLEMDEKPGLIIPRSSDLVCVPVARFMIPKTTPQKLRNEEGSTVSMYAKLKIE